MDKLLFSDFDPRNQPTHIKVFLAVFLGIFLTGGFIKALNPDLEGGFARCLIVHLFTGLLFDLVVLTVHALMAQPVNQNQYQKMDEAYVLHGICTGITEQLRRIVPEPANRDRVLRYYLLVRLGMFEEAKDEYAHIPIHSLHIREYAMMITARLRMSMMEGDWLRVSSLFANEHQTLESVYSSEPNYSEQFRAYEDDALDYYLLSAMIYLMMKQPEKAYEQRQKAEDRAQYRPYPEAMFFNSVMEMQRLYAEGLVLTADAMAQDLFREAVMLYSPVTPGAKEDLKRDIMQANAFGTLANAAGVLRAPKEEIPDAVYRQNEVKHIAAQ